ncbi:hypothetical protein [Streptomyces sp. NPDC002067]
MLLSASTFQLIGFAVLGVASVLWVAGLLRLLRREEHRAATARDGRALLDRVPRQTGPAGPPAECVELTAAEREAFALLVRQLTRRG